MNKFYLSLLAVAALTACSDSDESGKSQTITLDDSPVEVRLAAGGGNKTRASIESDDNDLFEADGLGIFMLATDKQNTNPDELTITWGYGSNTYEPESPYANPWAVWMENVEANAVKDDADNPTRTDILWADATTRWYPIGNWYSYRFYGYYPRVEADDLDVFDTQRVVHYYGLDGTTDIIWGRSAGADMTDEYEKYAYSARYFRQAGYADRQPVVAFEHKMMRLQFCIQGIADENAEVGHEFESANTMLIDTIIVEKVPTIGHLIVADLNDADNSNDGKISYEWTSRLADLGVIGENDGEFVKEQVNNDDLIKVGQPILLPVPDADAAAAGFTKYRVRIRLIDTNGVRFDHEKPLDLNVSGSYQPGVSYRVAIKIAGPKQVTLSATLKAWEPDNDTDDTDDDSVQSIVLD